MLRLAQRRQVSAAAMMIFYSMLSCMFAAGFAKVLPRSFVADPGCCFNYLSVGYNDPPYTQLPTQNTTDCRIYFDGYYASAFGPIHTCIGPNSTLDVYDKPFVEIFGYGQFLIGPNNLFAIHSMGAMFYFVAYSTNPISFTTQDSVNIDVSGSVYTFESTVAVGESSTISVADSGYLSWMYSNISIGMESQLKIMGSFGIGCQGSINCDGQINVITMGENTLIELEENTQFYGWTGSVLVMDDWSALSIRNGSYLELQGTNPGLRIGAHASLTIGANTTCTINGMYEVADNQHQMLGGSFTNGNLACS